MKHDCGKQGLKRSAAFVTGETVVELRLILGDFAWKYRNVAIAPVDAL